MAADTPLIITVGLTGSRIGKQQTPHIPITPDEIARSGIEAWKAGANAVDMIPGDATWSVIGIGRAQLQMAMMAMPIEGHVRVGLEDNIYYRRGEPATGNAQLVERVVRLAGELGRPVATPAAARRLLGLGSRLAGRAVARQLETPQQAEGEATGPRPSRHGESHSSRHPSRRGRCCDHASRGQRCCAAHDG